ncbi:hypothetical protein LO80_09065 [Candidatus Francisella endociliophora]|uniref:Uncharacterized protein n=2 Tax=Candidatus Francisella endociliophora TaxID=653937 RepID=A0A097ERD6_9GAMM|nr:hypothetical protein LO80_09065 [Francisella sp. FSC1006]
MCLIISIPGLSIAASESTAMDVPAEDVSHNANLDQGQSNNAEVVEDVQAEKDIAEANSVDKAQEGQHEVANVNTAANGMQS